MKKKLNRKWNIQLIHHTHVDIGYTHTQEEVLALQINHLKDAMTLIEENKHRKTEGQFRWNPEITWALTEWIKTADKYDIDKFINYVQEGFIGIDGLYGNILTGLCRPEELMESFNSKTEIEKLTNIKINSAMISDVPGWNWGFVTALAQNDIKYLSIGTNLFDRIGHILKVWKDTPFYWESPSGEKVLIFIHGKGYSWFHNAQSPVKLRKNLSKKLNPTKISRYLSNLEKAGYPYNTIILRYNIGADNGPPCHDLCDIVEKWNKENPEMHITIATTAKAMESFEIEYKDKIPTFKGDITPYWEDGAASTARETSIARRAAEKLIQAQILSSLHNKVNDLNEDWKNILLFNEHTWGAYNSISKPDHPFAISQWNWKKNHALIAYKNAENNIYNTLLQHNISDDLVTVINTHSWKVSQIVEIDTRHNCVYDEDNNLVISQRLSNGNLAFAATNVPSFSALVYSLKTSDTNPKFNTDFLTEIELDEFGLLKSINFNEKEFVKYSEIEKFNNFIFAKGKWGTKLISHSKPNSSITKIDDGPLIKTYKVEYDAYRGTKISSTIRINAINERIHLKNKLNRISSRKKEGLYFEYPFNIPDGRIKYDVIYGSAEVNKDQLKGSNKNFITATRWFDVSNDNFGMSCCLLDAPIIKPGKIVHDPIRSGDPDLVGWLRNIDYTGTVYSYIMNNYWMTNYKSDQPGETSFEYVFMPHNRYNEANIQRFSLEESQPFIVTLGANKISSKLNFPHDTIIVSSMKIKDNYILVRLWNPSSTVQKLEIKNKNIKVVTNNKHHILDRNVITLSSYETAEIYLPYN